MLSLGNNITSSPSTESKYGLILDGTGDFLDTGHHFSTVFNDSFTISFWAKPTDGHATQTFFGSNDGDADLIRGEIKGSGDFKLTFEGNGDPGTYQTSDVVFSDGQATSWTHILVTATKASSTAIAVYVNGVSVTTENGGGGVSETNHAAFSSAQNLAIGANNDQGTVGANFTGGIDEFAIFNVALDADAAAAVYNSGRPFNLNFDRGNYDNSSALQAYYKMGNGPFDDKLNGIVHDAHNPGFGSELVSDADFSQENAFWGTETGWTFDVSAKTAGYNGGSPTRALSQNREVITTGKIYILSFTVVNYQSGTVVGCLSSGDVTGNTPDITANGDYSFTLIATGGLLLFRSTSTSPGSTPGFLGSIKNPSLKELSGLPGATSGNPIFSSDAP